MSQRDEWRDRESLVLRQGALILDARTVVDGWQKLLLLGALVFLPVPVLTASGLAVPIPSLVYQVASGLATQTQAIVVQLPGFDAVVADNGGELHQGVIRRSAAELSTPGTRIDLGPVSNGGPAETGSNRGSRPGAKDSPAAPGDDAPARDQGPPAGTTPGEDSSTGTTSGEGSTGTPAVVVPTRPDPPPPPPPPPPANPPPPPPGPVELPIKPPKIELPPLPPPPIQIPLPPPPNIPGIPG